MPSSKKYERTEKSNFYVNLIESECGWGQRVDDTLYFDTVEEANEYVKRFNARNNLDHVPSWYMYADVPLPIKK